MKFNALIAAAALAGLSGSAMAAITLAPLTTFGGGDGWRAPGEVLAGDTAGTTTVVPGSYDYLGTGSLERGLAYNPRTGNLVLVSRSTAGNGIRLLSGSTGADVGALNQGGVITGGTFTTNQVGVNGVGQIYVANLTTNATTSPFKVYQFANEASTPTVAFNSALAAARLGDAIDVTGTTVLAGYNGAVGYAVIDATAGTGSSVQTFTPSNPGSGDFRLGITAGAASNNVIGKQTGGTAAAAPLRQTSYVGTTGTLDFTNTLSSGGEAGLDYTTIAGVPYLATIDANSSLVRIYDATDPTTLVLVASANNTTGTLTGNGNAATSIKWGAVDNLNQTATLYALSSNQGVQAFTLAIPEPTSLGLLAGMSVFGIRRRK